MFDFGSIVRAFGEQQSASETEDALNREAGQNRSNAQESLAQAAFNARRQQILVSQRLGSMRAAYGGSGVAASSGSVLAAIQSSATNGELDVQNVLHQGQIRAQGFNNRAALESQESAATQGAVGMNMFSDVLAGATHYAASIATDEGDDPAGGGRDAADEGSGG